MLRVWRGRGGPPAAGPWVLPLPLATRHLILVPYLIAEGVLSPLIMPAMLPDML